MRFDLSALARRASNPRRKSITIRDTPPPAMLATDLYQAGYKPIIDLWRAYADRIVTHYERTLAGMTTDSAEDINQTLEQAASEAGRLFLLLRPAMRSWAIRVEAWHRAKWRGAVLSALKVDIGTLIGPEDVRQTVEQALAWNANLVADVSAQARQRISAAVFDGLRTAKPAREVAKDIRGSVDMARDRSVRIASDQMTKLTSSLASERRRQAGIDTWEWVHSLKLHPRPEHAARNGKRYTDQTAPADKPGQLPYCGCRERAVVEFD